MGEKGGQDGKGEGERERRFSPNWEKKREVSFFEGRKVGGREKKEKKGNMKPNAI